MGNSTTLHPEYFRYRYPILVSGDRLPGTAITASQLDRGHCLNHIKLCDGQIGQVSQKSKRSRFDFTVTMHRELISAPEHAHFQVWIRAAG